MAGQRSLLGLYVADKQVKEVCLPGECLLPGLSCELAEEYSGSSDLLTNWPSSQLKPTTVSSPGHALQLVVTPPPCESGVDIIIKAFSALQLSTDYIADRLKKQECPG